MLGILDQEYMSSLQYSGSFSLDLNVRCVHADLFICRDVC